MSEVDDEQALPAIADSLAAEDLAGVNGPAEHVEAFRASLVPEKESDLRRRDAPTSYVLETVVQPVAVPGRLRVAREDDRAVMTEWITSFDFEALGSEAGRRDMTAFVDELLGVANRRVTSGRTADRSRCSRHRRHALTEFGLGPSTRLPSFAAGATLAHSPRPRARPSWTAGGAGVSCSPIWPTRLRTGSTRRSATDPSAISGFVASTASSACRRLRPPALDTIRA